MDINYINGHTLSNNLKWVSRSQYKVQRVQKLLEYKRAPSLQKCMMVS